MEAYTLNPHLKSLTHFTLPVDAHGLLFDGKFTILNPATGNWRTFQIRKQKENAKFAPGQKIISILVGPNNERDFQNFGFVFAKNGKTEISVWGRHRGTGVEKLAHFIGYLANGGKSEVSIYFEGRCCFCNRTLTTPTSVQMGYGKICAENHNLPYSEEKSEKSI